MPCCCPVGCQQGLRSLGHIVAGVAQCLLSFGVSETHPHQLCKLPAAHLGMRGRVLVPALLLGGSHGNFCLEVVESQLVGEDVESRPLIVFCLPQCLRRELSVVAAADHEFEAVHVHQLPGLRLAIADLLLLPPPMLLCPLHCILLGLPLLHHALHSSLHIARTEAEGAASLLGSEAHASELSEALVRHREAPPFLACRR
mmetsp:Transcript_25213/g.70512  ORF Transcript_25213/g.70512 Transcript_25213/m.70512 type:complete len:200 (+) Transcript_25213:463-1062(+)